MHSSVYRKLLVAMTCVLVLGAVGSASASASSWWAGGNVLASSEPLASSTTKVQAFDIEINSGAEMLIQCQSVGLKGADIAAPSGGSIEHLVLKECTLSGSELGDAPKCRLTSTTLESKALKLEAKLGSKSPEDYLVIKPASGEALIEIPFENGEFPGGCPFKSKKPYSLEGTAQLVLPKGREEAVEQPLRFEIGISGELNFARGELANLGGEYKLKLSSGKAWSYH
jgi:hypothetical protein